MTSQKHKKQCFSKHLTAAQKAEHPQVRAIVVDVKHGILKILSRLTKTEKQQKLTVVKSVDSVVGVLCQINYIPCICLLYTSDAADE